MAGTIINIILIIALIILVILLKKQKDSLDRYQKQQYSEADAAVSDQLKQYDQLVQTARESTDNLIKKENERLESYKKLIDEQIGLLEDKLEDLKQHQFEVYNEGMQAFNQQAASHKIEVQNELNQLTTQIDTARATQSAINEEILRRKEIEEKEEFFKVVIPESDQHDIQVLESIRPQLNKQQNLDKMIYDTYINKPTTEMIKRVLNGEAPSGIYRITRLKTGEVYIGKSTNIKDRWKQHAATAFNCGTIAHSQLHTTIEKDGLQNFTFEMIEQVPKDKLGEREKYWIQFYDSKKYGLNERVG